ncbi:MAG: aminotransferase class V-fold PLP-dependent enzyme [Candidatus Acidiferrum sp.]
MPDNRSSFRSPYEALLKQACASAQDYLASVHDRHVGVTREARDGMLALGGAMPVTGEPADRVLKSLDEAGSPATMATMGGRFFGGVIGGSLPITVAAHWLADAWDQNACLSEISPISSYLEEIVLSWLLELFDLPKSAGGALVTGTQMADVTALAAARTSLLGNMGWDVERNGLFGAPPITVVVGDEVHATMLKALALLGFGRDRVIRVRADSEGRMLPSHIPNLRGPVILCAQLGNVNTGACDPLDDICAIARRAGAWVHVDGAFGLWAATAPARRYLVEGLTAADSWATDGHKWLNTPQDCGIAIVRDREALRRAMAVSAAYYGPLSKREPMQWCPDSSRRARAVELWAALRFLGKNGVAEMVERTCQLASRFAKNLSNAGFEVLNNVDLNQVLVAFGTDEKTERVIQAVQEDGTCWCGGTVWKERRAMRISVSSWATSSEDVDRSSEAIRRLAAQVLVATGGSGRHHMQRPTNARD